jgi:hypothetical protein
VGDEAVVNPMPGKADDQVEILHFGQEYCGQSIASVPIVRHGGFGANKTSTRVWEVLPIRATRRVLEQN